MLEHEILRHRDHPPRDATREQDLLLRKLQHFWIRESERRGKVDREIVAHARLRERTAVAIHDLAARRGNAEQIGARPLLRVPSGSEAGVAWSDARLLRRLAGRQRNSRCRGAPSRPPPEVA